MPAAHAPRRPVIRTLIGVSALLCFAGAESRAQDLPLERIKLPPGFEIEVYAQVPQARSLALGEQGTVFVGTRKDSVYAIAPGEAGKREVIQMARGLNVPNGVAFRSDAPTPFRCRLTARPVLRGSNLVSRSFPVGRAAVVVISQSAQCSPAIAGKGWAMHQRQGARR